MQTHTLDARCTPCIHTLDAKCTPTLVTTIQALDKQASLPLPASAPVPHGRAVPHGVTDGEMRGVVQGVGGVETLERPMTAHLPPPDSMSLATSHGGAAVRPKTAAHS